MKSVKRNAFIAAGVFLYVVNAFFPISGIAESIASNTLDPRPSVSGGVQATTDIGVNSETLQYFMLDNAEADIESSGTQPEPLNRMMDQAMFEPLMLPGINREADSVDTYLLESAKGDPYAIKIQRQAESGFASIFINDQEVMKFRSGYDVLDPYDRAHLVAQRLYSQINHFSGSDPKAAGILPAQDDGQYVIKVGDEILVTVDHDAASANGNSEKGQAIAWTNLIRSALGFKPYKEPLLDTLANIISSPGTSKKYKLPLSTAYFKGTGKVQKGQASWYGPGFHGRRSSDGSRFDMNKMTAAHRYLPFGTVLLVKNNRNGKQCLVQITDRGPFAHGRILDLSKAAASSIGMLSSGTANITLEVLAPNPNKPTDIATPGLIGAAANIDSGKN